MGAPQDPNGGRERETESVAKTSHPEIACMPRAAPLGARGGSPRTRPNSSGQVTRQIPERISKRQWPSEEVGISVQSCCNTLPPMTCFQKRRKRDPYTEERGGSLWGGPSVSENVESSYRYVFGELKKTSLIRRQSLTVTSHQVKDIDEERETTLKSPSEKLVPASRNSVAKMKMHRSVSE